LKITKGDINSMGESCLPDLKKFLPKAGDQDENLLGRYLAGFLLKLD
jgi:hypothetical protein